MSEAQTRRADPWGLTDAEAEVIDWLVLGKTLRDIAAIKGRSARTIECHANRAKDKTGSATLAEMAVMFDRWRGGR